MEALLVIFFTWVINYHAMSININIFHACFEISILFLLKIVGRGRRAAKALLDPHLHPLWVRFPPPLRPLDVF